MVPGRISNTLSHVLQRRHHRSFSRLLVAAVMVVLVVIIVPVFALSSGSAAASSRPVRTASSPKLLPFGRRSGSQVDTPNWHGKSGLGFALVGSAPAGRGSSSAAVDEETNTIYVANANNANGPDAFGNTVSVIDGRRCQGTDVSGCKGPWPTLTVGNEPANIAVDEATDTAYVTNIDDNTVSVVNGATCNALVTSGCNQTPATVPVGAGPIGIFADEANHTVYIANFGDSTVSLLNSATCNGIHLGVSNHTPTDGRSQQ